jgi:glycine betaine catabolism B
MCERDYREEIDGFQEIQNEIAVLRKYGVDHSARKGELKRIIDNYHPKRLGLRISQIIEETKTTKTLRLVPINGFLPPFQAGQYISLSVDIGGIKTNRPYSIASPPHQTGYWDITVRRVPDGFVSAHLLDDTHVGDTFDSSGPEGHFYYNPLFHGSHLVFLAGGSGITPFMSMIREVTDRGLDRQILLVYGSANVADVIYRDELEKRAACYKQLRLAFVVSEPTPDYLGLKGLISAELLQTLLPDWPDPMFYLCGPEAMYRYCLPELAGMGIPSRRIRTEVFGAPRDITTHQGWPDGVGAATEFTVHIRDRTRIRVRAGEPLLNSLERHGIIWPSACRSGECSLCRVKLISGQVFQPAFARVRKSDRQFGYIHACAAYPLSDLEILL